MFYVVISEKGGSQKRLEFDKKEITIGRVQGNDIILPKGNVSKRHSRVVLKDGKFIIVDLKSTNGTFVNGRKISSPQVVKSADRIYIGDFTLSVETPEEAGMSPLSPVMPEPAPPVPAPLPVPPPRPPAPLPINPPAPLASNTNGAPLRNGASPRPVAARPLPAPSPAPPPAPPEAEEAPPSFDAVEDAFDEPSPPPAPRPAPTPLPAPRLVPAPAPPVALVPVMVPAPARPRFPEIALPQTHPRYAALQSQAALIEAIQVEEVCTTTWKRGAPPAVRSRVEGLLRAQVPVLVREKKIPQGLDPEPLVQAALAEVVDAGPLRALLADPAVTEVLINGPYAVTSFRGADPQPEAAFSSERGLSVALGRLLCEAGRGVDFSEEAIDARLRDGSRLIALRAPAGARGTVARLLRSSPPAPALDELAAQGALSEAVAEFLQVCLRARRSVWLVGGSDSGRGTMLRALARLLPEQEGLALVSPGDALSLTHPRVLALDSARLEGRTVAQRASQWGAGWMIARDVPPPALGSLLWGAAERPLALLGSLFANSIQDAIARLGSALRYAAPGSEEDARAMLLARVCPIVIFLARAPDGPQVLQVTELLLGQEEPEGPPALVGLDLFLAGQDGLQATREIPSFWQELLERGEADGTRIFE